MAYVRMLSMTGLGVFCTYCALAILFMFLYQVTFFTALMVLHCRREIDNRHWLICIRVRPKVKPQITSDEQWSSPRIHAYGWSAAEKTHRVHQSRFYSFLSAAMRHWSLRLLTLMVYCAYLCASFDWISQLELGMARYPTDK